MANVLAGNSILFDIPCDPAQGAQYVNLSGISFAALTISPDSDIDIAKVAFTDVNGESRELSFGVGSPLIYRLPGTLAFKVNGTDSPRLFRSSAVNTWFQNVNGTFGTYSWDEDTVTLPRLRVRGYLALPTAPLPRIRSNKQRYMRISSGVVTTVIARLPTYGRRFISVMGGCVSGSLTLNAEAICFNRSGGTIDNLRVQLGTLSVGTIATGNPVFTLTDSRRIHNFDAIELSGTFGANTVAHLTVETGDLAVRIL